MSFAESPLDAPPFGPSIWRGYWLFFSNLPSVWMEIMRKGYYASYVSKITPQFSRYVSIKAIYISI